jgi:Lipoprotein LpqB beta-propeller domain/Sporulation and spore germination
MTRLRTGTPSPLLAILLACSLLLVACVSVPTQGPIERINAQDSTCQNCVSVEVNPPMPGDDPQRIVENFLRATSNYQPNYSVARQFLTRAAAQEWSPEDGATIYSGDLVSTGASVTLEGVLVGRLGPDRTYTVGNAPLSMQFNLMREDGEWRINTPPRGLMVERSAFASFYRPYNVYFIGNGSVLVPDLIYLPSTRAQTNLASVLMTSLLAGASTWLRPAVTSAIPQGTALSVDAVTVNNGIAEVPFSDTVLALNEQQRGLMAAQVAYTLRQVAGVEAVLFTVNQQPLRMPYGSGTDFTVPVDAVPAEVEPVPYLAANQLYVVRDNMVQVVDTDMPRTAPEPVPGPLGSGAYVVDSLAVSVANTDLAVVTQRRTELATAPTAGGPLRPLIRGVSDLLRPQFSRFNEVWAVGRSGGRQRFWVFQGDRRTAVEADWLSGREVLAFKLSPDGVRMALIVRKGRRVTLELARISRTERITVDGLRTLDVRQSRTADIRFLRDVGWLDANNLLVLGATTSTDVLTPYAISQDGYRIMGNPEPSKWDIDELTILLPAQSAVVVGRDGQSWRDDGRQWQPYLDRVQTAAAPG